MTTLAVKVVSTRFALLPKSPDLHQRAVTAAEVELRGSRWTIASIHFSLDADERLRHLDALRHALEGASAPLVLAGDVNEPAGGAVWTRLTERFQDAYAVAPDGRGETFTAGGPHRRIDGIFAAAGIEVVSCHAVHEAPGVDAALLQAASDHLPVLAVLRQ
jgi:endonuclease/exonuclease/phosphatase family metal-dependent hydrolase